MLNPSFCFIIQGRHYTPRGLIRRILRYLLACFSAYCAAYFIIIHVFHHHLCVVLQDELYMHLTNYAINKSSKEFIRDEEYGSKRRLSTLYRQMEEKGIDVDKLKTDINDIIIKTLIAAHPVLKHNYRTCFSNHIKVSLPRLPFYNHWQTLLSHPHNIGFFFIRMRTMRGCELLRI